MYEVRNTMNNVAHYVSDDVDGAVSMAQLFSCNVYVVNTTTNEIVWRTVSA